MGTDLHVNCVSVSHGELTVVRDVRFAGTFEGITTVAVGVDERRPFRLFVFREGDVRHVVAEIAVRRRRGRRPLQRVALPGVALLLLGRPARRLKLKPRSRLPSTHVRACGDGSAGTCLASPERRGVPMR